jgi:hypothetical protein
LQQPLLLSVSVVLDGEPAAWPIKPDALFEGVERLAAAERPSR